MDYKLDHQKISTIVDVSKSDDELTIPTNVCTPTNTRQMVPPTAATEMCEKIYIMKYARNKKHPLLYLQF